MNGADEAEPNLSYDHLPVMLDRAVELLDVRPGLTYVDATAGGGGHLTRIEKLLNGSGRIIAIDQDLSALERLRLRFNDKTVQLVHANFGCLASSLAQVEIDTISGGIIADLGVSSMQLDDPLRGFSFMRNGPLDMRMNTGQSVTAHQLVNYLPEEKLANIIFEYGEERHSRSIAKSIVRARPIETTEQLAEVVARSLRYHNSGRRNPPKANRQGSKPRTTVATHPATRTFQALRIAVNSELDNLASLLEQANSLLLPGARLVIITFHSLEDRMVKEFFRQQASNCICPPRYPVCVCNRKAQFRIVTRKAFVPDEQEILANVRSRSAKLRAGEKVS